jgi:hypothetical protein
VIDALPQAEGAADNDDKEQHRPEYAWPQSATSCFVCSSTLA